MDVHVEINHTQLSILTIPRHKSWIFTSSLLLLLYAEYDKNKCDSFSNEASSNDPDSEMESPSDSCASPIESTTLSSTSAHLIRKNASSANFSVDNSSKDQSTPSLSPTTPSHGDFPEACINSSSDNLFFHIAFSPQECTVVCETAAMTRLFSEALDLCRKLGDDDVLLLPGSYISFQIDSDGGFDHSRRIIDLTKPLSDNGISLFFLLTHFNDLVLVPASAWDKVDAIVNEQYVSLSEDSPETNSRAGQHLFDGQLSPVIGKHTKLLLTGARLGATCNALLISAQVIARTREIPDYFAVTRTAASEVSLILPQSSTKRRQMGFGPMDIVGSAMDTMIPVTVDLRLLPLDSTGIVAGLASKLVDAVREGPGDHSLYEMSYLSMARSGIVLIPKENIAIIAHILAHIDYSM